MVSLDPGLLTLLITMVFVGAIVSGMTGMGFALTAMNGMAAAMGARNGVIAISILTPVTAGYQLWSNRDHVALVRRLRGLLAGAVLGSFLGAQLLILLPGWMISLALGLFTVQFVVDTARRERPLLAASRERQIAPLVGIVSGVTNGALGASGPVVASFLLAIGLRGREFVFGISLLFVTQAIIRASLFVIYGEYTEPLVLAAVALLIPALVGQQIGINLRGRIDAKVFQRILLVVLFLSSVNLIVRGGNGMLDALRSAGIIG
jgi:hypothetical protein